MRNIFTPLFLFLVIVIGNSQSITGELKKWHKVTIEFTDDETYSETGTPNPFLDRRLNVTFTSPSNNTYVVPGYFAADGNAAETSATSGNKWHVHFAPDEEGTWTYTASFREGTGVAVTYPSSAADGSASTGIDSQTDTFTISATDKSLPDNRAKGRLVYDGTRYPKFSETGEYFIKAGPDSPENFLAYNDFDDVFNGGVDYRKDYSSHVADWQTGDPIWQTSKGKGIIGAINYLSGVGMNSISFLTMNKNKGDTFDVTMHVDSGNGLNTISDYTRYDVSRIAQWEIVFEHASKKGMFLHFKTQEQENAAQLGGSGAIAGNTERKLYYRELIARFGHHLVLNWNMGEENEGTAGQSGLVNTAERIAQLKYVKDIDPYQHLRVVHSGASLALQDAMYDPLLGNASELTGISMQSGLNQVNPRTKYWAERSFNSGKQWVISTDETGTGGEDNATNRADKLYGAYFAGGYGVEYYFQGEDFTVQDFRSGDKSGIWASAKHALDFMKMIPFTEMNGDNTLISGSYNTHLFYKNNEVYAIYKAENVSNVNLDTNNTGDTYTVRWYDVRNGGALQNGSIGSITFNGADQNIGLPPNNTNQDWIALITNNSVASTPQLSINNVTVVEGGNAIFNVTLNNAASGPFSVEYSSADGTAVAGSDYTLVSGILNFDGAPETKTITVSTTDDAVPEDSEQFTMNLTNVTGGVEIADASGAATITDNDAQAFLSIDDVTVTEGVEIEFTITLNNAVSSGFTIDYSAADNSATFGEDYTGGTGSLNFVGTAGEEQIVLIPTIDDMLIEGTEQFVLNLSSLDSGVSFTDDQGLATINDNDSASISITDVTIEEGTDAVFSVSLDNAVSGGFTVDFATANNSATAGEDYSANTGTLTFAGTAGETLTITITTTDDALVESNEEFFVNLANATNGVTIADAQGIATILDNDAAASIFIDDLTVTEGTDAVFTVSLNNAVSGGFTVDFATANNSATAAEDYTANTGTLTFAGTAGETQTITIATTDDALVESNEEFFVNLTNATNNVTIADSQGMATIIDNDAAASISIDDLTVTEGSDAVFTVSLDNSVSGGFSVDFATANNSATAGEDYTANTGTLTFAGTAGETQTITIATADDALVESNEDFFVNLTNATNNVTIANAQGTATINDNDSENEVFPTIDILDAAAEEGNIINFPVTLSAAPTEDIELAIGFVNISTTDADYDSSPQILIFQVGQTEQNISVALVSDLEEEAEESFQIVISEVIRGNIENPDETAIGSIFEVPQIIVFPVPFVNEDTDLNVSGLGEGTYGLSIFTLSGQTLASEIIEVNTSTLAIPVDDIISNGTYVLVLENAISGDKIIKRFIIQR